VARGAGGGEQGCKGGGGLGGEVLPAVADDVVPAVRGRRLPVGAVSHDAGCSSDSADGKLVCQLL
jgi:hypothetical protein